MKEIDDYQFNLALAEGHILLQRVQQANPFDSTERFCNQFRFFRSPQSLNDGIVPVVKGADTNTAVMVDAKYASENGIGIFDLLFKEFICAESESDESPQPHENVGYGLAIFPRE